MFVAAVLIILLITIMISYSALMAASNAIKFSTISCSMITVWILTIFAKMSRMWFITIGNSALSLLKELLLNYWILIALKVLCWWVNSSAFRSQVITVIISTSSTKMPIVVLITPDCSTLSSAHLVAHKIIRPSLASILVLLKELYL